MIPRVIHSDRLNEYEGWFQRYQAELLEHLKRYFLGVIRKARKRKKKPNPKLVEFIGTLQGESRSNWIHEDRLKELRYFVTNGSQNCAYCEQPCSEGIQLDHFLPKTAFPSLAFDIHNLVPSCPHCNKAKGHGTNQSEKEIIHPYSDCPKEELAMSRESLKLEGRGHLGKTTLAKLGNPLNSVTYIGDNFEEVKGALLARRRLVEDFMHEFEGSEYKLPKILKNYLEIHLHRIPKRELSATRATILCDGPQFRKLVEALRAKDPEGAKEIDALMEEKRAYSLFADTESTPAESEARTSSIPE